MSHRFRTSRHRRPGQLATIIALLLTVLVASQPVRAQDPARQRIIEDSEYFLNTLTTLEARFLQINPDGSTNTGTLYIHRPGRMRMEYDPPSPLRLIANGRDLIIHDSEFDETSYIPLSQTPAHFFLRSVIHVTGPDILIRDIVRQDGVSMITLADSNDPDNGTLSLLFSGRPHVLRGWIVRDGTGSGTRVALEDIRMRHTLDPSLFRAPEQNR